MSFKIGDKVKVVKNLGVDFLDLKVGTYYTVTHVRDDLRMLDVRDADGREIKGLLFNRFKSIRKFKLSELNERLDAVKVTVRCPWKIDELKKAIRAYLEREGKKSVTKSDVDTRVLEPFFHASPLHSVTIGRRTVLAYFEEIADANR